MEKIKNLIKSSKFLNIAFCFFVAFGFFSLMFLLVNKEKDIDIPLMGHVLADIRVNIETKDFSKVKLYANEEELPAYNIKTNNSYMNFAIDNTPVFNISLKLEDDKVLNDIQTVILFISDKMFYFDNSEIKKFEKKNGRYYLPNVKYLPSSDFMTDKGALTHFSLCFLSIFYNMKLYLLSILSFALAILAYVMNKNKIELGFTLFKNHAIWIILLLGIFVRLQDNSVPFWGDELYTSTIAGNPALPFSSIFSDPGNPPLFFLLAKFWGIFAGQNEVMLRLLPCIFSVLSIFALYIYIKDNLPKSAAILVSFLYMINVYSIYSAHEYRSYSLGTLFCALSGFYLFKILKETSRANQRKYLIIYTVLSVLMANTHYFQLLILFANFLYFIFQKIDYKIKIEFFISNIIAALSFLPYFFITSLNGAVLDKSFNPIHMPNIQDMIWIFAQNYTNGIVAFLVLILGVILIVPPLKRKLFNDSYQEERIFLYSLFVTLTVFTTAFLLSQIRPVVRTYYFVNVLPFIITTVSLPVYFAFKNKISKYGFLILFFGAYFFFSTNYENRDNAMRITVEQTFKYAYYDSFKYKNPKIAVYLYDFLEYAKFYKQYIKDNMYIQKFGYFADMKMISKLIEDVDADIVYLRLELMTYADGADELKKFKNVTLVRSYNDSLIAKIEK